MQPGALRPAQSGTPGSENIQGGRASDHQRFRSCREKARISRGVLGPGRTFAERGAYPDLLLKPWVAGSAFCSGPGVRPLTKAEGAANDCPFSAEHLSVLIDVIEPSRASGAPLLGPRSHLGCVAVQLSHIRCVSAPPGPCIFSLLPFIRSANIPNTSSSRVLAATHLFW